MRRRMLVFATFTALVLMGAWELHRDYIQQQQIVDSLAKACAASGETPCFTIPPNDL